MRVFLTGATGFLGRALTLRLRRDGHEVCAWVRTPARARGLLGAEIELVDAAGGDRGLRGALSSSDAVVHLAGEAILPRRWTRRRRDALIASRVRLTDRIVQALADLPARPRVLVSGSAVGFYGDRAGEVLPEDAARGDGFLSELCAAWEASAQGALPLGMRVVTLRTGVVLGRDGGALAYLLPLQRARLGGVLGSGDQWVSWIHLDDWVELALAALTDARYRGPLNATAPNAVTQREFTDELARALGGAVGPRVPAFVLRAALGEAASALLMSQRVAPDAPARLGFQWAFPALAGALGDIVRSDVSIETLARRQVGVAEPTAYLDARPPRYLLRATAELPATLDEVFAFFARAENLGAMTPANLSFRILRPVEDMGEGTRIDYRIRLGALPLRWRTRIERFRPPQVFVDAQAHGPYRSWWHEHRFHAEAGRTIMEDRVYYALPFGWFGRLAHRWFVARALRRIFGFRAQAMRFRFGIGPRR